MLAIIAGTGIEQLVSFAAGKELCIDSIYGKATVYEVTLGAQPVLFIPRHSKSHTTLPHLINHRAHIAALKKLGATQVLGFCSVGSLRVDLPPGTLILLNDFINICGNGEDTFFAKQGSPVVHTDMSVPYCPTMRKTIERICSKNKINIVSTGTYINTLGPRYETPAEIRAYRAWDGDVVGMTNAPECTLSHEAGMCYCAIAIVTNLGSGLMQGGIAHSDVESKVQSVMPKLKTILNEAVPNLLALPKCECSRDCSDILGE